MTTAAALSGGWDSYYLTHTNQFDASKINTEVVGFYAVEITSNNCTFLSACNNVVISNIEITSNVNQLQIWPNPTNGVLNLLYKGKGELLSIEIQSVSGQIVKKFNKLSAKQVHQISLEELPAGLYLVQVQDGISQYEEKIIKQ